ncbi:LysM peptidoglycan-binding domain-containing protein [Levilactobacillus spicheri]
MKKFVTTILATSAAALGLFVAGTVSADASTTYTVKSGDSVWTISQKFDSTINAIENANNIQGHLILPGQNLTIPDGTLTSTQTAATTNTQAAATTNTQQAATTSQSTTNTNTNTNSQASTTSSSSSSYTGSNMKEYVLSQMSSRTGVSASTWNAIIQRESNWQANVVNSTSGAYGLFQNMHISSGSVEDQVNAAVSLYNQQGMAAWAL